MAFGLSTATIIYTGLQVGAPRDRDPDVSAAPVESTEPAVADVPQPLEHEVDAAARSGAPDPARDGEESGAAQSQ